MNKKINLILKILYYIILAAILIIGIIYRTDIWIHEPGLWGDEGPVFVNVAQRNIFELIRACKFAIMSAPYSFLFFSKIIYYFFGFNETALRFTSYMAGILSMFLIPPLCKKVFKKEEVSLIFLPVFIFNSQLCYYSQQFKQYSLDVFFSTLILYLFFCFKDKINNKKTALYTGIFFGIAGFLSFPCIFLVSAMFLFFVYRLFKEKKYKEILILTLPFVSLLLTEYLITFHNTLNSGILYLWDLEKNILSSFDNILQYLSFTFNDKFNSYLIASLYILGIIYLLIKERYLLVILIVPVLINSISGFLNLYPCNLSRVILYTSPFTIIICLKIFDIINPAFITKRPVLNYLSSLLIMILSIFLLIHLWNNKLQLIYSVNGNSYYFYRSNSREYVKKLDKVKIKPDDIIFVDREGEGIFVVYDTDLKYSYSNVIYQSVPEAYDIYDPRKNITPGKAIKNINDIPKNSYIYFYNTHFYPDGIEIDKLEEWIKNNTVIIKKETDDIGEFLYVKKIT